jgi:hypothetical protein
MVTFPGVAAERVDVVAYPGQRGDPVEHAAVVGGVVEVEEALDAEPVADGHEDDAVAGEGGAVVPGAGGGSGDVAAAVDPDEDRQVGARGRVRGEDVEVEYPVARYRRLGDGGGAVEDEGAALRGGPVLGGVEGFGPRLGRDGGGEAEVADGGLGVGDAEEAGGGVLPRPEDGTLGRDSEYGLGHGSTSLWRWGVRGRWSVPDPLFDALDRPDGERADQYDGGMAKANRTR